MAKRKDSKKPVRLPMYTESKAVRRRFAEACRKASADPKLPPEERENLARLADTWQRTLDE